jgi:hypothetical protein
MEAHGVALNDFFCIALAELITIERKTESARTGGNWSNVKLRQQMILPLHRGGDHAMTTHRHDIFSSAVGSRNAA